MDNLLHFDITGEVIKDFYKVYNTLGYCFLEKVYENAMAFELEANGLFVQTQLPVKVVYNGSKVGTYFADIVVEHKVIIEIKTAAAIDKAHESQLLNYLKATELEVGVILNFGQKTAYRRKVFTNQKKDLIGNLLND